MFKSQGSPLGFKNGRIPRVPPWDQKCSNPKGPPLGSKVVESQGSPLGIRNVQIPRVPPWDQKCSNPKGPSLGSKMVQCQGSSLVFHNDLFQGSSFGFKSG